MSRSRASSSNPAPAPAPAPASTDHEPVVCPGAKLHPTLLLVEREELDIDAAVGLVDRGRVPVHLGDVDWCGVEQGCERKLDGVAPLIANSTTLHNRLVRQDRKFTS